MSTTTGSERPATQARPASDHPGPPLNAPAVAFLLFFAAGTFGAQIAGVGILPSPFSPPALIMDYVSAAGSSLVLGGFLLFLSAAFLVIFAAIAHSRLQFLAPNAPGPVLGSFGFFSAAVLLGLSGLLQSTLGQPGLVSDPAVVQGLLYLQFVVGGAGHTALLGIGVVGLAVTNIFIGRIPRWLSILGIVFGIIAMLSSLSLVITPLAPAIPLGRFTSMIWLVVVAFLIPRNRAARRREA